MVDPLEILPSEMWTEIFDRIKGADDWLNLYRASSSSFRNVVGPERHQALFPHVLPLLSKYLIAAGEEEENLVVKLLPLRHVSHKWREGVDRLIESELKSDNVVFPGGGQLLKYHFCYPTSIAKFLTKFEHHHSPNSPFIGSTILLWHDTSQDTHETIMRLMAQFGRHLKGLTIVVEGSLTSNKFLAQVRELLQFTPALEKLNIWDVRLEGDGERLRGAAAGRLFLPPTLPNLKSIVIQTSERMGWMDGDGQAFFNVRGFLRTCFSYRVPPTQQASVEQQASNELIPPPPCTSTPVQSVDLQQVLPAVSHLLEILTFAHSHDLVRFGSRECFEKSPPLDNLPRLTSLGISGAGIEFGVSFNSLDFMEHLPELQEFRIQGWSEREYKRRNEARRIKIPIIIGGIGDGNNSKIDMRLSNVWKVLPRLRKLDFSGELLVSRPNTNWIQFRHVYWREEDGAQLIRFKSLKKDSVVG